MGKTVRVSMALDEALLRQFDEQVKRHKYQNRSEAVRDLIRAHLVSDKWQENQVVVGTITIVYDHHVRELSQVLTRQQHESRARVLASMHIHLDDHTCLEVVAVKGRSKDVRALADALIGTRGVLHGKLAESGGGRSSSVSSVSSDVAD